MERELGIGLNPAAAAAAAAAAAEQLFLKSKKLYYPTITFSLNQANY